MSEQTKLSEVDVQCSICKKYKGTYRTRSRCENCGYECIAVHSLGHEKHLPDPCPRCECRRLCHGDYVGDRKDEG